MRTSARGAEPCSMSEAQAVAASPADPAQLRSRSTALFVLLGLVAAPVLMLDQATKIYVSTRMGLFHSIPVVPNWFDITYTRNPGAAFSVFASSPEWFRAAVLVTLSIGAIVALAVLIVRGAELSMTTFGMALILAGAIGNLIDRVMRGEVVDFLHAHYYTHSFPIFNCADSAITIGVTLIILHSIFTPRAET